MLFDFFRAKHECQHKNVPIDREEAYCPDCGALVRNKWFLVRCSCCNIKRNAHMQYSKIKPDTNYCPNCGSADFYVEELQNINLVDVHYAVFKKVVISQAHQITRQIWIEEDCEEQKLLCSKR